MSRFRLVDESPPSLRVYAAGPGSRDRMREIEQSRLNGGAPGSGISTINSDEEFVRDFLCSNVSINRIAVRSTLGQEPLSTRARNDSFATSFSL
jgi:hypothetical protein